MRPAVDQIDSRLLTEVHEAMLAKRLTLSVAESCTGGLLSAAFVERAGASAYFDRGFVCYSNQAKIDMLGLSPLLIKTHGAVCVEVAKAMAEKARALAHTTFALSVTGVAGPEPSEGQPVGTIVIGLATPKMVFARLTHLSADASRAEIRKAAVRLALELLRNEVQVTD